jgi:thioredoxin 1
MLDLSPGNFDTTTSTEPLVLVQCWAPWCKGCVGQDSAYAKVAEKYPQHVFGRLNTEEAEDIVSRLGLEHIPALLVFREGILLLMQSGQFDEEQLGSIVSQAEQVDMDQVRAEIASKQEN